MLEIAATRKAGRHRQYCSHIQYCLLVLIVPMVFFLLGAGALTTQAHTNSAQFQMLQTSTITQQEMFVLGETFKIGDLQYRINSVRTLEGDGEVIKPPSNGKTFLIVDLTIENLGNADVEVRSNIGFKLKDQDGQRQDASTRAHLAVKDAIDGTIKAGGRKTGELGYEVSKETGVFMLTIIPDPLSSKAKIATVKI